MKKIKFIAILLTLFMLFGCVSAAAKGDFNAAKNALKSGNDAKFLNHITRALMLDREHQVIYKYLATNGPSSIIKFEGYYAASRTSSEPKDLARRYFAVKDMVAFYDNLRAIGLPISDPKNKYKFDTVIKDYSSTLAKTRVAAYNAYFKYGKKELSKGNINNSLNIFNTAITDFQIPDSDESYNAINSISWEYSSYCKDKMNSNSINLRLKSWDSLKALKSFNPEYSQISVLEPQIKNSIADYYYRAAVDLETTSVSEDDIKKTISLYDKALSWVPNYKDAKMRKEKVIILAEVRRLTNIFNSLRDNVYTVNVYFGERLGVRGSFEDYNKIYKNLEYIEGTVDNLKKAKTNYKKVARTVFFRQKVATTVANIDKVITDYESRNIPSSSLYSNLARDVKFIKENYDTCSDITYKFKRAVLSENRSFDYLINWISNTNDEQKVSNVQVLISDVSNALASYENSFKSLSKDFKSGIAACKEFEKFAYDYHLKDNLLKSEDTYKYSTDATSIVNSVVESNLNALSVDYGYSNEYIINNASNFPNWPELPGVLEGGSNAIYNGGIRAKGITLYSNDLNFIYYVSDKGKKDYEVVKSFYKAMSNLKSTTSPDEIVTKIERLEALTK